MENNKLPKPKVKQPDRIPLTPDATTRLSDWMAQVEEQLKGIHIKKSDLASFILLSQSEKLDEKQLSAIRRQFFDEVRFAQWALREVKSAKQQGIVVSLTQIVAGGAYGSQRQNVES